MLGVFASLFVKMLQAEVTCHVELALDSKELSCLVSVDYTREKLLECTLTAYALVDEGRFELGQIQPLVRVCSELLSTGYISEP